jgi:hypothetical protein
MDLKTIAKEYAKTWRLGEIDPPTTTSMWGAASDA